MQLHRALVPTAVALVVAATLTGCGPTDLNSAPSTSPSTTPSPSASETTAAPEIPDDAVLIVTGVATASNGAITDIRLIVHAPAPYDSDTAADAVLATETWCAGEVDMSVFAAQNYSFTDVDVQVTLRDGPKSWPLHTPLLLLPLPWPDTTLASSGDLEPVDQPTLMDQPASGIPHCARPVLTPGPGTGMGSGTGTLYLGIAGDKVGVDGGAPFTAWANHKYGFNANLPGTLPPAGVTFSECASQLTALGTTLGAPTAAWQERFESAFCVVGGATGGE